MQYQNAIIFLRQDFQKTSFSKIKCFDYTIKIKAAIKPNTERTFVLKTPVNILIFLK